MGEVVGRITVAAIGAAGVVVAGLSVASATLWRPDDVLRASMTTDSPYVVTAAGVVEMGGQPTTVDVKTVDGKKAPLVVAVGRDTDVAGWVGADAHETISGMSGWSTLGIADPETEPAKGEPAEDQPAPDAAPAEYQSPAGSDMWLAEASGEGRAELKRWAPDSQYPGRWSVLVANPTEAQVTIELAWPRNVSTPWLIPGLVVGLGLVGAAAYLELRRRGMLAFGRGGDDAYADTGKDVSSPPVPRSRREMRAAQASGRSGPVPVVDQPRADVAGSAPPAEPEADVAGPASDWAAATFAPAAQPKAVGSASDWGTAAFAPPAEPEADVVGSPSDWAAATFAPAAEPEADAVGSPSDWAAATFAPAAEPEADAVGSAGWGTASFAPHAEAAPQTPEPGQEPRRRALSAWSPARTWQRARHSDEPEISETSTRGQKTEATPAVASPAPVQPPPAAPERPRTPAWSRAPGDSPAVPDPAPAPTAGPAPPERAPASGRRRAWPAASQTAASPLEDDQAPVETGPTAGRGGPFGRGARPGSSSAPTLGGTRPSPAPPSGWMPGRGGRTGAVPQAPGPTEQSGRGRRPAWLSRSPESGPVPAAPQGTAPQGTAPRLSAGPQAAGSQPDTSRGDAWRQIWGISTDDGSQEEDR